MPEPMPQAENIHGTALLIGDRGVLITGASGAGKTTLALTLIDHCRVRGLFARLISDDRVLVANHAGRLVCRVPVIDSPASKPKRRRKRREEIASS